MLVIRAGIYKILVGIENREDDRALSVPLAKEVALSVQDIMIVDDPSQATAVGKSTNRSKWASSRQNLSSGFPTKQDSSQSHQLQRLARKMELCMQQA